METHFDESKVPDYVLPHPLITCGGGIVRDADAWWSVRREEILDLFKTHVYGHIPHGQVQVEGQVISENNESFGGRAIRREIRIRLSSDKADHTMNLLLYLPKGINTPVPLFLGLNFWGNHTVDSDPGIAITDRWVAAIKGYSIMDNRATEEMRGCRTTRWPIERILARGYGVATIYYGELSPDYAGAFMEGVHKLFPNTGDGANQGKSWGAISAWAFGLSCVLDYLSTEDTVDFTKVAVIGHSRLGKAALWAGALDQRFAMIISNNSGCGGAAISRRKFGETVEAINHQFPHWFCKNFHTYNGIEETLPLDQHMLLALAAPRPIYVASASEDLWADPKGEFLAAAAAQPVYKLLGCEGLPADNMPALEQPVQGTIGYHIRKGGHDITNYDWDRYMDFADRHFCVK